MAHLASIYAADLGCKIGYPVLQPHYFPVLQDKYITFHNSDKCPSKSFSYWEDVIKILKPELEKRNIKVFQIGTNEDKKIDGVDEFYNTTSFKQSAYLIDKSQAHFGIDSSPLHIASALNKPTLSLYAHAYESMCGPLWNKDKAITIESNRNNKKPSFSNFEDPKMIDLIKPEEIANSVFKMLNISNYTTQKTIFIGEKYKSKIIDVVPTQVPLNISADDAVIRIRMDIHFDENVLAAILQNTGRQVEIITNRQINENLIESLKPRISKIIYNADRFNAEFLKYLKHSGLDFELTCTNKNYLAEERLKFFNYEIVLCDKKKKAKDLKKKYGKISGELRFYSGRFYLIGEKVMATIAKDQNDIQFWNDAKYFRIYETIIVEADSV
jgi:hypothetical protein